ncbi:DNA cytosine methyltransferase [Roseomonas gilardii]|uniref:DNA (cytosine-5-)-methyltransferase n=1 Tax=Roseomonas gilardii TaxID=257708 RepID=A0ABU3MJU0_9PROT|nr:DNA cytosine methyltransferase [Roseomonas gilardii]MDT8333032.1 DNA cytosine methyltransferase [Roseomonas gilardii]
MSGRAIDLFAGAGGFTTGATQAGATVVWAANHWRGAVDIHAANHPDTEHSCQDLHQADWTQVPAHDLLLASPCCQGHSRARGKNSPQHDASRSTAWAVVSAAEFHRPGVVVVENVPEFQAWTLYPAWTAAMGALGYTMSPHVLDAADHGVPQHRRRLILVGTRSRAPLRLDLERRPHVPAAEIIDVTSGRWSEVQAPRRSLATLARVSAARSRFGARFVMPYYGSGSGLTGRSLERPIGTITTLARWAVVDGDRMRMLTVDETRAAMGFPAGYRLPQQTRMAIHMLGNAVPPPLARDVVAAVMEAA